MHHRGGGGGGWRRAITVYQTDHLALISEFVNSSGTHDPKISTDLLHDGYVPHVHFRIITAKGMEVLHEYLLFAS